VALQRESEKEMVLRKGKNHEKALSLSINPTDIE
jgi:hypothetical protein